MTRLARLLAAFGALVVLFCVVATSYLIMRRANINLIGKALFLWFATSVVVIIAAAAPRMFLAAETTNRSRSVLNLAGASGALAFAVFVLALGMRWLNSPPPSYASRFFAGHVGTALGAVRTIVPCVLVHVLWNLGTILYLAVD